MKKSLSACFTLMLSILFIVNFQVTAYANGGGDGSGNGKNRGEKALVLETSSIENNAKDVELNEAIKLTFSNNIVHMSVAESNQKMIKLLDETGSELEINVEMADDQIEREKRNDVIVTARESLKEGSSYKLLVDQAFQAKNGSTLAEPIEINFSTVGGQTTSSSSLILYSSIGALLLLIIIVLVKKRKTTQS